MRPQTLAFLMILSLVFEPGIRSVTCEPVAANRTIDPPTTIEYENVVYVRDKAWKADEIRLAANLDDDPDIEIFIGFVGTWHPENPTPEGPEDPMKFVKSEIPIVEHRVFYQILDPVPGKKPKVAKMWTGMDQIGTARTLTLDPQGPPALLIVSPGGTRYNEVRILRWQEGGYPFLFNESTRDPVQIVDTSTPVKIELGSRSWTWDGSAFRPDALAPNTQN